MNFGSPNGSLTFLFTDIEGSTRLWEQEPQLMRPALARHDALVRAAVEQNRGTVMKMSGHGVHAAFADSLDAALQLQQAVGELTATTRIALPVRCGLHAGVVERRDNDFFGRPVNRAARIMSAAHGGQVLLSQVVADVIDDYPDGVWFVELAAASRRANGAAGGRLRARYQGGSRASGAAGVGQTCQGSATADHSG